MAQTQDDRMTQNHPKKIWLTGASSGIGHALAQELLKQGHSLALTARQAAPLTLLAQAFPNQVLVVTADLTVFEQVHAVAQRIEQQWGGLDMAILNAGTCEYIDAAHFEAAMLERVMRTNFIATAYCIEAALPLLRQGSKPQLVATSSSATYFPLPRAGAYGASKAAMDYLLASLRLDLMREDIAVTTIHPGFVDTPLTRRNDFAMPMRWSSERAAQYIAKRIHKRPFEINFPRIFVGILKLLACLPLRLQTAIGRKMNP
jgi:NAD(P)-dependent dehydrogenase (short-subunit alcohol dehydrogenase family)